MTQPTRASETRVTHCCECGRPWGVIYDRRECSDFFHITTEGPV